MIIKILRNKIGAHQFLKNVVVLASGNILGYAINLLSLPIISRIYMPGELGEYDLIISSGRFAMDFIGLGLMIVIMLPEEDKKARQICQLIRVLNLSFLCLLFGILSGIQGKYRLFQVSMPYTTALLLLALYMFSYNMQSLYYSYANRCKEYGVLFWTPLLLAVTNVGVSIVLGLLKLGVLGYLIGTISSYVICCIYMQIYVKPFKEKASIKEWVKRLKEYKEIPLVQMPANVISQIGNEIPTQYLGRMFGSTMLGGYSMATRILNVPISLLSVPINKVVYQAMAEKRNKNESVGEFLFQLLDKYIKIAILPVGAVIILGEWLIPFVLGTSWRAAGQYIVVLGAMSLLKFCSSCVSGTFVLMGRQKISLLMSFVNLAKLGICFGGSYYLQLDLFGTIIFYAATEFIYQLLNLTLCVYCTDYSMKKFMIFVLKYLIGGNVVIYLMYFLVRQFI